MKVISEHLNGLKLIKLDIFSDNRGFFSERFAKHKFDAIGVPSNYIQDNFSRSKAGVIRGLHFQKNPDQAKLVGCTRGKIMDVAVDIRKSSKTFGQHFAVELSDENGLMLYIPAGFAHGFAALTEADVMYKVDGGYNKEGEGGIIFNDADININWGVNNTIVSDKDLTLPSWRDYLKNPVF
jgi:dTDP-4-dehydrorhamnose 3,5-epimerase